VFPSPNQSGAVTLKEAKPGGVQLLGTNLDGFEGLPLTAPPRRLLRSLAPYLTAEEGN